MAYKGKFFPKNPHKYRGNVRNIVWRSTWELKFFNWCDTNSNILEWASEEVQIPYVSPIDNRIHRYFPDVWIKMKNTKGEIVKKLIEIKPKAQTHPPKKRGRITPKYLAEAKTWQVNCAKWEAAEKFCEQRGWEFHKVTENTLFKS